MPSANPHASAKPYSPRTFSRRTRQRFTTDRTRQLLHHLGRPPSYPENIIIARVISLEWWLRRLDARIDADEELSGHAIRGRLAAETRLKLDLAMLGIRPQPAPALTLAEHNARLLARGAA